MAHFQTNTGTLYYEVRGSDHAANLTLLHNFLSTGQTAWGSMLDELSATYRVLVPDSPGHGRSQGFPDSFDHREMARQLAELMEAEGALDGHLVGVSSGGMMAQQMVHLGYAQPATLTLVSTTYSNDASTTGVERSLKPEHFQAGKRWLEATARLHDPHHYDGYFDQVLLSGFRKLDAEQTINLTLDNLSQWSMPVCLIHGANDEFFPERLIRDMAEAFPNSELHIVSDQPHAMIFRRPWAVKEILLSFLQKHT